MFWKFVRNWIVEPIKFDIVEPTKFEWLKERNRADIVLWFGTESTDETIPQSGGGRFGPTTFRCARNETSRRVDTVNVLRNVI